MDETYGVFCRKLATVFSVCKNTEYGVQVVWSRKKKGTSGIKDRFPENLITQSPTHASTQTLPAPENKRHGPQTHATHATHTKYDLRKQSTKSVALHLHTRTNPTQHAGKVSFDCDKQC